MKGIRHKTSGIQRVVGWCETTERKMELAFEFSVERLWQVDGNGRPRYRA